MIEKDGKIVEATTNELFSLWLRREMDLIMSFPEYVEAMQKAGCVVRIGGGENAVSETTLST